MTLVLKKNVSALSNITVYDLHFALVPIYIISKINEIWCDFMIRMYVLKVLNGHIQNLSKS